MSPSKTFLKQAFEANSMARTRLQDLSLAGADLWIDLGRRHAKQLHDLFAALPGVDDKEPGDREVILAKVRVLIDLIELRYELISGTTDYSDPKEVIRSGGRHATWMQILATQRKRSFHPIVQQSFDILIGAYACAGYLCRDVEAKPMTSWSSSAADLKSGKVPLIDPIYLHSAIEHGNLPLALSFIRCGADWKRVPVEPVEATSRDRRTVYIKPGDFDLFLDHSVEPGAMRDLLEDAIRTRQAFEMHARIDGAGLSNVHPQGTAPVSAQSSRRRV